jgi:putative ABC transport system ATP-binding protein
MSLVRMDGIEKRYESAGAVVPALRGVDLEIDEGSFVALMGRSGSGKSTLLSILGAMSQPTRGTVVVDGVDVYSLGQERRADFRREYLGFVFQQLYLMPYLTAIGNVMLPLAATSVAERLQREMARAALSEVGLSDKIARLPRDLSGGEQQRVAIARALVNRPPIVLADEPTGCLDTQTGREIIDLFVDLKSRGLTIFMVTHDARSASRADRVVHIEDGLLTRGTNERTTQTDAHS